MIEEYLNEICDLYDSIISYIDDEDLNSDKFQEYIKTADTRKTHIDKNDFKLFLCLLSSLSINHHRTRNFFDKIQKIVTYSTKFFTSDELMKIFKKSKPIMLFLLQNGIVNPEKYYNEYIKNDSNCEQLKKYFYPEIKPFINDQYEEIEDFESKRQEFENELYICSLIRNDSVVEFVQYVNQKNVNLSGQVPPSLFETNQYLIGKSPTLIEYATFFGAIQIFDFLQFNGVELNPILWYYAIHSNDATIIHRLEDLSVKLTSNKLNDVFYLESIMCNHNEIAKYFQNDELYNEAKALLDGAFNYHNIEMVKYLIDTRLNIEFVDICYKMIEYDFINLVDVFVKEEKMNYKTKIKVPI